MVDAAVRAVMAKINKKSGAGTVILGSEIAQPLRETITSGSLNVDVALGGGWATNHWVEIVGHESSGKTLMVLKMIAANQKLDPNWTVIWFATEDFVDSYAQMMGCDLSRIVVENENTMEAVFEHTIEFLKTKAIDCIVIDSLPGLVPAREEDATMEDFQPGLAAFLTGKFFRKSNPSMKRSMTVEERPVTGFVINQWREKIGGYGDPRTTPGGKAKNFFFFQRVDVKRDEFIKNTKGEPIGQVIQVRNIKNKYSRPGRLGSIDAYIADGNGFRAGDFDLTKDMVSAAIAYDVITRPRKGYYAFAGTEWYGRPKLDDAIETDKALRIAIRKAVRKAASEPMPPTAEAPRKKAVSAQRRAPSSVAKSGAKRSTAPVRKAAPRVRQRASKTA